MRIILGPFHQRRNISPCFTHHQLGTITQCWRRVEWKAHHYGQQQNSGRETEKFHKHFSSLFACCLILARLRIGRQFLNGFFCFSLDPTPHFHRKIKLKKNTRKNLQTNLLPRLLLHRQKLVGKSRKSVAKSRPAKVARQRLLLHTQQTDPKRRRRRRRSYKGLLLIGFPCGSQ